MENNHIWHGDSPDRRAAPPGAGRTGRGDEMADLSMREAYGRALADYAALHPEVVALDVDTSASTLSSYFAERFPDRFFNIGIAEPCMVDVAVGPGAERRRSPSPTPSPACCRCARWSRCAPACATPAPTSRSWPASPGSQTSRMAPPTTRSPTWPTCARCPNMTVIVPADAAEAAAWVPLVAEFDGPVYLRISRAATLPAHDSVPPLQIGKGLVLRPGSRPDAGRHRRDGRALSGCRRAPRRPRASTLACSRSTRSSRSTAI